MLRASVARNRRLLTAWRMPTRTALFKRSAGKDAVSFSGVLHQRRAAITARLAATNAQNGVDTPKLTIAKPPRAGPTVRLRL